MCNFNIEKSKDGYDLVRVYIDGKWIYIGSKYNQKKEIDEFIEDIGVRTIDDVYVVIGLSCGEHIRELIKLNNKNESNILVYEPNNKLLKSLIDGGYIDDLVKDERITIIDDNKGLEVFFLKYINTSKIERVKLVSYANYKDIYLNECGEFMRGFKNFKVERIINRNTNVVFSKTWVHTLISNLNHIKHSTPLNKLINKYENIPAIIVSAGPSLDKNIDQLKGVKNALILAGSRTLKPLLEKGIKPHGVVAIDPSKECYDLVDGYIDKVDCPLFFYDGTNEQIVSKHNGPKIISGGNGFIDKLFDMSIESMNFGGSVAHSSTKLAVKLGCNPIIFVGQDLAYTNNKAHAYIAQTLEFDECKRESDIYVDDIYGNKVLTSLDLNAFRLDFEYFIKQCPNKIFIDATEGGAYIKGTKVEKLSDVLKNIENKEITQIDIEHISNYVKLDLRYELEKNLKIINKCESQCKDGKVLIQRLKRAIVCNNDAEIININDKLDVLDVKLRKNIMKLNIIQSIMIGKIYEVEQDYKFLILHEDSESDIERKVLEKNITIYKELESCLCDAKLIIENYLKNNLEEEGE